MPFASWLPRRKPYYLRLSCKTHKKYAGSVIEKFNTPELSLVRQLQCSQQVAVVIQHRPGKRLACQMGLKEGTIGL